MKFEKLEPYLYLLPILIGIVLLAGGAILASFLIGFTSWDLIGTPQWVGLKNYEAMFSSALFWKVFRNTFYYVLLAVPPSVLGSLALAVLVNRKLRGISIFQTV